MNSRYDQISGKIAEHVRLTLEYVKESARMHLKAIG